MAMVIIGGHVEVAPTSRDEYVDAHRDLVERARVAPGCLDVAISADPVAPGRVNTFELWESEELLDAWRAVAHAPDTGIEFVDVDVQLYVVADVRPPFSSD